MPTDQVDHDIRMLRLLRTITIMTTPKHIAVVGAGVAGLGAAWALSQDHHVTLIERNDRLGGHARTIDIPMGNQLVPVDTGFIVYNERNYPNLENLFSTLDVPSVESDMSFSVTSGLRDFAPTPKALFGNLPQLLSRDTWDIMRGITRFRGAVNRHADLADSTMTLGEYLTLHRYSDAFSRNYLLPLAAAVWSGAGTDAASMPIATFMRFLKNHGLFEARRPQWRTVSGGSREYVERIEKEIPLIRTGVDVKAVTRVAGGVEITADGESQLFDEVVLATHAPQTVDLVGSDLSPHERDILGAFRYAPNRAVVHRDPSFMPRRKSAWSAWNAIGTDASSAQPISVTYWMNRLQNLDERHPVFVTLNPVSEPSDIIDDVWYQHPQFNLDTDRAQRLVPEIQGTGGLWYCGAWMGYGFHEDGLSSGLAVAAALGSPAPWHHDIEQVSPASAHSTPAWRTRKQEVSI